MRANQYKKETSVMKSKILATIGNRKKLVIQTEYEVERICDKRIHCGKTQYLVKWKDYSQ
jgi:hypothetical protein